MKIILTYFSRYCWFSLCFQSFAQTMLTEQTCRAVNNYLIYSNEVIYSLTIMHDEFEQLNNSFNQFVELKATDIKYSPKPVLSDYEYFPVLPDSLYLKIYEENQHILIEQRVKALEQVKKINAVSQKIDDLRNRLDNYINSGSYKNDKYLEQGYKWLRQIEVAYFDIYALQDKLYWNLNGILNAYYPENSPYTNLFLQLNQSIQQSKRLLKAVRAKDKSAILSNDCKQLRESIRDLKLNRNSYLSAVPADDTYIRVRYDLMIKAAESLLSSTTEYLNSSSSRYSGLECSSAYYYYNIDQLGVYNRFEHGMTYLYNRLIIHSKEKRIFADELPPIFEVVYPEHPAFDSLRNDAVPDVAKFMEMLEKKRLDSLNQERDSIPMPSMDGFAANNLILLLDISASMDSPEKLPLLKQSLEKFLGLLREEDYISIIAYSDVAELMLPPTSAKNKVAVMNSLNNLKVKTSSNIAAGLQLSYAEARKSFISGGNNRIILSTDGNFKLDAATQKLIKKQSKKDIKLSVFYFSDKEYKHVKTNLSRVADFGKGKYSFISSDNAEEALLKEAQSVRK